MKSFNASSAYSIEVILDNAIISKSGDISLVYELFEPECYSLSDEDMDLRHSEYMRAFSHISYGYIHRQDIYLRGSFDGSDMPRGTFISDAEAKHFNGRELVRHHTLLAFTSPTLKSLEKSYQSNPLKYKENLSKEDKSKLSLFLDEVEQVCSILSSLPMTDIRTISEANLHSNVISLVNGYQSDAGLRDILCSDKLYIGSKVGSFFCLCDENYLPDEVSISVSDRTLGHNSSLCMSMLEPLGIHLDCSHVINQIWCFRGNYYNNQLKESVKNFGRHKSFDKDIEYKYSQLSALDEEIREEQKKLCEYHYNLMIIEENEELLERASDKVKSTLTNSGFSFYIPSYEGLYKVFIGSVLGRETNLAREYFITIDLDVSLCLSPSYTASRSDCEGIYFEDRIFNSPMLVDVWDERKKRIPARNAIVIASTGGGKSVTTLNIIQQLLEQKVKVIVVEFGKSFYQLSQLYKEKSLHIDYSAQTPLGINPFFIPSGAKPDKDKIRTLVNLILVFWRMKSISSDTPQVVSLTKILTAYYDEVSSDHSFPSFYEYIKVYGDRLLQELSISPEYFDKQSFLHVCSEFCDGGYYENVCKISDIEEEIAKKDFIIFELTQIKKDPFLVSVIMSILFDTIESKILSDRSQRGMLVFDEYAESQAIKDSHSGADIHSPVAFVYQKRRNENGAIMTIIQSPAQLPENEYTKGIISNTQILYVLPTTNVVYSDVEDMFKFDSQAKKNLMRSIKNDFSSKRKYSEVFISFGDKDFKVLRLELSPEKFLAFQTDGSIWQELQEKAKNSDIQTAITDMLS